jgi:hypothetical protein
MLRRLTQAALLVGLAACEGSIMGALPGEAPTLPIPGTPNTPSSPSPMPPVERPIVTACEAAPTPGPAPMRRLSHEEYENALLDLFGDAALARTAVKDFVEDTASLGFRNSARFLDVKLVQAQKYMTSAEWVAAERVKTLATWLPCSTTGGEACARQLLGGVLKRMYRRSLTQAEQDAYLTLWRRGSMNADFKTGVEWMLVAALQAPNFLYRAEVDGALTQRPVSPVELASRLSFLLWRSIPDEALLAAAEQGRLVTKEDVEREARRMLEDVKAERIFEFFEQWLDVDEGRYLTRDPALFSNLPAGLGEALRAEAREYVKQTVLRGDASLAAVLAAPYSFVDSTLAQHYGVSVPAGGGFHKVTWTSGRRGGLFMASGALVSHDKANRTSIVNRGARVRTLLLCQTVPAPPDDVPLQLGPIDGNFTQGDRLEQHRTNPSCAGCHGLLDPLGEPFENIDAVGRERSTDEYGRPVKTAGEVVATQALDGEVAHGLELMQRFSQADEVRECVVTQLFRFSHGRQEESADLCSRQRALEAFKNSGWNVKELFVAMTQTDDFLFKPAVTP